MKKIILLLILLLAFYLFGCSSSSKDNGYRQISMDEAISIMDEETGMISAEAIDSISDTLNHEFEQLLDIEYMP